MTNIYLLAPPNATRRSAHLIVVVSALCADFEPQARHYNELGHCLLLHFLDLFSTEDFSLREGNG
ncbi:MAG: hypothetical protein ABSG04_00065 [Verrucomicrobiota bacterium]|jgi:hypothetical protein